MSIAGGTAFDIEEFGDVVFLQLGKLGELLFWDYPGYGASEGEPTIGSIRLGARAVAREAAARRSYPEQPIFLWGHSLGGFVCAEMASEIRNGASFPMLVLETSASDAETATRTFSKKLPFVTLEVAPSIADLSIPDLLGGEPYHVIVLGGARDKTLPVQLSRALAADLKRRGHHVTYEEFEEAGHFTVPRQEDFHDRMVPPMMAYIKDWLSENPDFRQGEAEDE